MDNYVYKLYYKNGIIKLENKLEAAYGIKASVQMKRSQKQLSIVLTDRNFGFIAAYEASDFNLKPVQQDSLPFGIDKLPKSGVSCDDETIRKFYLRFMKNEFETYYEDYKAHQLNLVEKDLGSEAPV